MEEVRTTVITCLSCAGGIYIGLQVAEKAVGYVRRRKTWKGQRAAQKKRLERYRTGDRRPAPIRIAIEYGEELKKPSPIRKATGLFSDETAQEVVK